MATNVFSMLKITSGLNVLRNYPQYYHIHTVSHNVPCVYSSLPQISVPITMSKFVDRLVTNGNMGR